MNLICFPHYTCGGFFCDLLNKETSPIGKSNNIESAKHNIGKVPPKNSYNGTGVDEVELYLKTLYQNEYVRGVFISPSSNAWLGTHCWPGNFDTSLYNNILLITTENKMSRLYRYARVFYTMIAGVFAYNPKPQRPTDIKSYKTLGYDKVIADNVYNLEFEDVVEWKPNVEELLLKFIDHTFIGHIHARRKTWVELNDFLYDRRIDYIIKEWEKS